LLRAAPTRLSPNLGHSLVHTLAVLRDYLHLVERRSIDVNRHSPRSVWTCDEYLPFALLVAEPKEVCLIIHLKIQHLFVSPPNLAGDLTDFSRMTLIRVDLCESVANRLLDPSLRAG
jgi:hypothetical protein